jgi:outer membrane receptor protein involved in Fe transport
VPGRLQKVAALAAVAWGFAGPSLAQEANAPGASLAAVSALESQRDRGALVLSQSNAVENWSLRAGAWRGEWDFTQPGAFRAFDGRFGIAGDIARAGLAFDWQRRVGTAMLESTLIARLSRAEVSGDPALQRLRDSSFGTALRWSTPSSSLGASFISNANDAERGVATSAGTFERWRADRFDESTLSLLGSTRWPGVGEMFLTLRRKSVAFSDTPITSDTVEIGFRRRLPLGIETTVSMFRTAADHDALVNGENAITPFARPTVRQGVQFVAHHEPRSWVALDFNATMLHARYADGAAEYVPGAAERNASASATVRGYGWSASLLVSYLGKRSGIEEPVSLRASTFVNARLSRSLSKNTRLSFDVFNLFDQRLRDIDYFTASRMSNASGAADSYLFNPAEPRGFRLKLRTTF